MNIKIFDTIFFMSVSIIMLILNILVLEDIEMKVAGFVFSIITLHIAYNNYNYYRKEKEFNKIMKDIPRLDI